MPTTKANGEIEWSYDEVEAELTRMGLPTGYPPEDTFDEMAITRAIGELSDYYLSKQVAEYQGKLFTADQLKTWAAFVVTLGKDVKIKLEHDGLAAVRDTTREERRGHALSDLASKAYTRNREAAKTSLTLRYESDGTDAAGYKYDNGLTG
jgi:hypothetical protein